jgi:succinate dehydrogenase / fumarate reductase flavoprotein subunit
MAVPTKKRVIVVGGGLAGLACSIKLAEEGVAVDLFSMVPVKRSHSVCAQGGINACNEIARQQGYSEWEHFEETALGGDFLADQPPVLEMTNWAPKIIDLLDRMGVPFNRTPEGQRALRLFGGSLFKRTFYAGATTGQQLLYALDERVLGIPLAGAGRWQLRWHRRAGYADDADPLFPRRCRRHGDGWEWADLRQEHDVGHLHRRGTFPLLSGRGDLCQPRDDPGASDRHPG